MNHHARELAERDVCVLRRGHLDPLLTSADVEAERLRVLTDLRNLPGFRPAFADEAVDALLADASHKDGAARFSLGSFGALNVRHDAGQRLFDLLEPALAALCLSLSPRTPSMAVRAERIRDRLVLRLRDASITSERWHRDVLDYKAVDRVDKREGLRGRDPRHRLTERVIQGWINLGPGDTRLTHCPGSALCHAAVPPTANPIGFARIPDLEAIEFKRRAVVLVVRPGDVVLFDQTVAHAVAGGRTKAGFVRLHFAFRLTTDPLPLWSDEARNAAAGLPSRLPSGQHVGLVTGNFRSWPACVAQRDAWLARRPFADGFELDSRGFLVAK
jgi:hypothetical protein